MKRRAPPASIENAIPPTTQKRPKRFGHAIRFLRRGDEPAGNVIGLILGVLLQLLI